MSNLGKTQKKIIIGIAIIAVALIGYYVYGRDTETSKVITDDEALVKEEKNEEEAKNKVEDYMKKGYYVLEKDGKIVSQALIGRELIKGKGISCVYTPKEERGKGYAYNIVYKLSKKCLDEGAEYCVLYTDAENPISNYIYEKIGYVKKTECKEFEFYK